MAPLLLRRRVMRATVTIVSTNPRTLDGLQSYLRGVGVAAKGTRSLADCAKLASEGARRAVVLFPDDYRLEKVVTTLADLDALRPPVLPVLVTAHPQRFYDLTVAGHAIIMPRPVWGWTILDAIRAQFQREGAGCTDVNQTRGDD